MFGQSAHGCNAKDPFSWKDHLTGLLTSADARWLKSSAPGHCAFVLLPTESRFFRAYTHRHRQMACDHTPADPIRCCL